MAVRLYFLKESKLPGCDDCEFLDEVEIEGKKYYVLGADLDPASLKASLFPDCEGCIEFAENNCVGKYDIW